MIIFSTIFGIITFVIISWLQSSCFAKIPYEIFIACELVYYTYIYPIVDNSKYQLATSHTRSSLLIGRFFGLATEQLFIVSKFITYNGLIYSTIAAQFISFTVAMLLPAANALESNQKEINCDINSTENGIKMAKKQPENVTSIENNEKTSFSRFDIGFQVIHNFKSSYSNVIVVKWSFLSIISMCVFMQVKPRI